jgi:hypothetical protein
MPDNYKIILDDDIFRQFIEWLPELAINEKFYVALFARKKYCAAIKYIKTDKAQCKRFLSTKKDLYLKVKQLECPINSFTVKEETIPQEALALYISMNPRDMLEATRNSLIKLATLIGKTYNGYNPHQEVMSEVHKACSRKVYFDLDFDNIEWSEIEEQVLAAVNPDAINVLKTKNGFHLLIKLKQIHKDFEKTWYKKLTSLVQCDVRGDNLIPIAGCTQGGFIPHFIV